MIDNSLSIGLTAMLTPLGYFGDPAGFDYKISVINHMNDSKSEAHAIELFFNDK